MVSIVKKVTSLTISSVLLLSSLLSNTGFCNAAEEEVYYYLHDHLGGIEAVMDEDGNVVERRDYLPYGKTREEVIAESNHPELHEDYGYTGKELDEETGLYYYGARYYSPVLGRFITPDPVVFDEGKKSNTGLKDILNDPQKLNSYTYANNNPLKYVDATGEIGIIAGAIAVAGFVGAFLSSYQNVAAPDINSPPIHTRSETEILTSMAVGELVGGATGYVGSKIVTGIAKFGFKTIGELKLYRQLIKNGKNIEEAAKQAKNSANHNFDNIKGQIKEYLSEDLKFRKNDSGDVILQSQDELQDLRFDVNNTAPHKNPHVHATEYKQTLEGKVEIDSQRAYPKDVEPE